MVYEPSELPLKDGTSLTGLRLSLEEGERWRDSYCLALAGG